MRLSVFAAALSAALLLSACSSVADKLTAGSEVTQTHIMGNIWERTEVWSWEMNPMTVKEKVSDNAQDFCEKQKMSMQPLDQTIERGQKDASGKIIRGASAKLRFRCVETVNPRD